MDKNKNLFIITDKVNDFELLEKTFKNFDRIIIEIFGARNYLKSFFHKKIKSKHRLFSSHLSFKHKSFITIFNIKQIAIPCNTVNKNKFFKKLHQKRERCILLYA